MLIVVSFSQLFLLAVEEGNREETIRCIEEGADPTYHDPVTGDVPLIIATNSNDLAMVRMVKYVLGTATYFSNPGFWQRWTIFWLKVHI